MKKLIVLLACAASLHASAQGCASYEQMKKGVVYTMTSYNAKDKVTSTATTTVNDVKTTATGVSADMTQLVKDEKGKEVATMNTTVSCEGGTFNIDMKNFTSPEQTKAYKDMNMSFEGNTLQYPSNLTVGSTLPDGTLKMKATDKKSGAQVVETTMNISERKVVAKENITTTAGTFECYKITYTFTFQSAMTMPGGQTMNMPGMKPRQVTEWYSTKVGAVRSETWKEDKMESYTVLTEFKK
jgi:hypothetical protein